MENIDASSFANILMKFIKHFLATLIHFLSALSLSAQISFSDSLQVSLLTCSEGHDAYERFGHTAIRILDQKNGQDLVFHWGLFDFSSPNFAMRFVKGETDYQLGAALTENFIAQYRKRGLAMTEQILNLDREGALSMLEAILINYRPENRTYRYSYFFDNCATRPFNIIDQACRQQISYDTAWVQPITLRDMVQEKTKKGSWLDFGTCLLVASRSDKQATFREQMFMPDYLAVAYSHATLNEKPLVKKENEILEMREDVREAIESESVLSPLVVFILLFVLMCVLLFLRNLRWAGISLKTLETFFLIATGAAGIIVWFLNFLSEHPSVDNNVNCLWLLPTNLVFAALIWIKSLKNVCKIYFFIIFAAVIIYIIINLGFAHQYIHPAFAPIIITLLLMCGHYCPRLLYWKKESRIP